jgi:hypothetical protein
MVVHHIDPDDRKGGDLSNIGFNSTLTRLVAREGFSVTKLSSTQSAFKFITEIK